MYLIYMVLTYNVLIVTTSTSVNTSYDTLFVNPGESTVNISLPAIAANGQRYLIKRIDATENTVVILPNGSDTVAGASSQTIGAGQIVEIVSVNTNWEYTQNLSL